MAFEVRVPAVGESVQEGEVYKWHKGNGDFVDVDEVLLELETDKATVEIVAEQSGVVSHKVEEGDTVKVGDLLAVIDTDAKASAPKAGDPVAEKPPEPPVTQSTSGADNRPMSPAVSRMVNEHNLETSNVPGTGRDGRLLKEDLLSQVGSGGAPKSPAPAKAPPPPPPAAKLAPAAPGARTERREKMSRLRQKIAERLVEAQHNAAMLTTFNEIDMTAAMELRKKYKEKFKETHGVGLGFMSFFVKAAVAALKECPAINGYVDGDEIIYHDYYDIGVAVSTDRGLMVPVVRDCDRLTFAGVEANIMDYAVKGRAGKISIDDLSGGTFTISNGGVFGSLLSTPILNPPQSAILGMHKIQQRPMVENGEVVVRPMMYVALSYDHRIVDGKEAVGFLVKIKESVEDPSRLLLEV